MGTISVSRGEKGAAETRIEPDLNPASPGSVGMSVATHGSVQQMLHLLEIQGRMQPEV